MAASKLKLQDVQVCNTLAGQHATEFEVNTMLHVSTSRQSSGSFTGNEGFMTRSTTGPVSYTHLRMCMERNYDPLIVFSFSKKECENLAKQVGFCVRFSFMKCTVVLCCLL